MSICKICGAEIPTAQVHLIYAFVSDDCPDIPAQELCPKHTDLFIDFIGGGKG